VIIYSVRCTYISTKLIYVQIITYEFLSICKFSITYRFYIRIYDIQILHTDSLHTDLLFRDPNPYIITYGSKSVCNYLRILHTDSLSTNFIYGFITYEFYIQILHTDPNPFVIYLRIFL